MRTTDKAELARQRIDEISSRLRVQQSCRALMEPIKVVISSSYTRQVLVLARDNWAIDDQGKIYHQKEVDGQMVWSPVNQQSLDRDRVCEDILRGLEAISDACPPNN